MIKEIKKNGKTYYEYYYDTKHDYAISRILQGTGFKTKDDAINALKRAICDFDRSYNSMYEW